MTADVPLLSSYKRALVARLVFSLFSKPSTSLVRRLVFTVTGFRLVPGHAPFYSLLLRLLLWLLPLLLVLLPAILPPPLGPSLAAALILGFTIALRLASCVIGQKPSVGGGEGEEEELVWDGVLGPTTWTVLLPPRHLLAGLFLQVHFLSFDTTKGNVFHPSHCSPVLWQPRPASHFTHQRWQPSSAPAGPWSRSPTGSPWLLRSRPSLCNLLLNQLLSGMDPTSHAQRSSLGTLIKN